MCGIVGFIDHDECRNLSTLRRMIGAVNHRGPDANGDWTDPAAGIALGHARLAIVDLSALGAQPMTSQSGRFVIVFNGEIFNFRVLSNELEGLGYSFRGGSDTEVMLAAIEQWGVEAAVERFVGMFAFALWDRNTRELSLVRDRLGIKPLYYGWFGRAFVFSSELHALRGHPGWTGEQNVDALGAMLELGYVPSPLSVIKGVFKLPPGCIHKVTAIEEYGGMPPRFSPYPDGGAEAPVRFWNATNVVSRAVADPLQGSAEVLVDELDRLLREVIELRMISDVPLGAFLSGGIDSSLVVSIMQQLSDRPVRTFCIGFDVKRFDEAHYGAAVAKHLGTEHTELYVSSETARDVVPSLARMYDEPFGDSSQIPTHLVSALCRKHVTVALSGDGGDELFGGYTRFETLGNLWRKLAIMPTALRSASATFGGAIPSKIWDLSYELGHATGLTKNHIVSFGDKLRRIISAIGAKDETDFYYKALAIWPRDHAPLRTPYGRWIPETPPEIVRGDVRSSLMYSDLVSYLSDDILAKVDRASMSVALEARVPLLDHRLVEFAWRVPLEFKFREGRSKWILRKVLDRYVPKELVDRPKVGFSVPLGDWLRGELRDWTESLLAEDRLREDGLFDLRAVRSTWQSHLSGRQDKSSALWNVLMIQAWRDEIRRPLSPAESRSTMLL